MILRNALLLATGIGLLAFAPAPAKAEPFDFLRNLIPQSYDDDLPDGAYVMDEEDYYQYLKRKRARRAARRQTYYDPDVELDAPPIYEPPRRAKRQAVKPVPKTVKVAPVKKKPIIAAKPAPEVQSAPKTTAVAKPRKPASDAGATTASTSPAGGMSCGKATSIVSGYGFDSVSPSSCAGKVYAFSAKRGGQAYLVRLDAASGELTEVKKQ
jgi:hypothetical protein